MSFMSFVSGKSNRSSSGISQTDHDRYDKPRSAQGLEQQQHAQTTTTTTTTSTGTPFSFGGHEAPPHVQVPPHPPGSYPRSLDTPGLDPESEDEDNLGALPAFGISERGYLASLVSLFGGHPPGVNGGSGSGSGSGSGGGDVLDTNSSASHSPLSALTAITAPSVLEDGIGIVGNLGRPYEYDVHSPAVYAYAKVKDKENERLFVGLPGIVHPPPEALLEFELETLPLLERDLHELAGQFGQRGIRITYELRMSGLASNNLYGAAFKGETVILSPTVWILYRSYSSMVGLPSCQLELEHAVSKLHYLQHRPVEVQEGGGRIELAGDRRLVDVKVNEEDCIHLSGGGALSVHIEDIASVSSKDTTNGFSSVCGALCSITIEEEDTKRSNQTYQSLCRIGGLLLVNGKYILGVSTAHAMLDSSNIFKDSFDNASEPRSLLGKAVDRDIIIAEAGNTETITTKWADVTRDAAVDFLGVSMNSRGEMAINRSNPENATDFALLRLRQTPPGELRNQYTPPGAEKPVMITSSASASAASLDEGPVYILCRSSGDKIVDGQLVWGSACFVVRGRNFHLRRIQTSRPLSKLHRFLKNCDRKTDSVYSPTYRRKCSGFMGRPRRSPLRRHRRRLRRRTVCANDDRRTPLLEHPRLGLFHPLGGIMGWRPPGSVPHTRRRTPEKGQGKSKGEGQFQGSCQGGGPAVIEREQHVHGRNITEGRWWETGGFEYCWEQQFEEYTPVEHGGGTRRDGKRGWTEQQQQSRIGTLRGSNDG